MCSKLLYENRIERNWNLCSWTCSRTISVTIIEWKMQEGRDLVHSCPCAVLDGRWVLDAGFDVWSCGGHFVSMRESEENIREDNSEPWHI